VKKYRQQSPTIANGEGRDLKLAVRQWAVGRGRLQPDSDKILLSGLADSRFSFFNRYVKDPPSLTALARQVRRC
jgi:hypothetical protein